MAMQQGQIAGTSWDPNLYGKFSDHRLRPALELLERVPLIAPGLIYDLGCGPGEITRIMAEKWPGATVYGLDNSKEMLAQAGKDGGRVQWIEGDIRTWEPDEAPDLIYSNATLQWVENHRELFPRLVGLLRPGGCLAVQVPLSFHMRSHELMRETLMDGGPDGVPLGSRELRRGVAVDWLLETREYYDLLAGRATNLDIWEVEYVQVLEGPDPVLEWVKSTGLRPVTNGLSDDERPGYLQEYGRRLREAYPTRADGKTLYPFRRLFMVGVV